MMLMVLGRDIPTTAEDVEVLRRLRAETPGWFLLTACRTAGDPAERCAGSPSSGVRRRAPVRPAR
jgi:hypothetical protein